MKRPANLASTISVDNVEGITTLPLKRRKLLIDSTWTVGDPPELPYLYLKEKTSVVVLNDIPQLVANRIVSASKGMNCIGEYDDTKAKATLKIDDTEFCIQLFKVTEKSNECIIVEMHRKFGSALVFHTVARSILAASKNVDSSLSRKFVKNPRLIGDRMDAPRRSQAQECELFPRTMEIVAGLLKKDRVDAKLLGMESLQLLTSTRSSSDAMVTFTSDIILNGGNFGDVKEEIVLLIAKQFVDPENDLGQKYHEKMRICALSALSNALDSVSSFRVGSLEEWVIDDGLLFQLLNELKLAEANPHEAYLAGKCLVSALEKSSILREYVAKMGASKDLVKNVEVGHGKYHLLGRISAHLLQLLKSG